MTNAQRIELAALANRPRGGMLTDWTYVYPRKHFEALERLGYVTFEGTTYRERYVKITDAGRLALDTAAR